jgi:hypothetical protein
MSLEALSNAASLQEPILAPIKSTSPPNVNHKDPSSAASLMVSPPANTRQTSFSGR